LRDYDKDFKEEAIKLSYEIGPTKASEQLGIPLTTLYTWRGKVQKTWSHRICWQRTSPSRP